MGKPSAADIERTEKTKWAANVTIVESDKTTEADIADLMLDDELREMGYGREHVKVYPCCRK